MPWLAEAAAEVVASLVEKLAESLSQRGINATVTGNQVSVAVSSSFIQSLAYDPDTQTLTVNMAHGSYDYPNIPQDTFQDFAASASPGQWFNQNLKGSK